MTIAQILLGAAEAGGGGGDVIDVTISTTQTSQVNLFTLAGSPVGAVTVNLVINGGVVLQRGLTQGTGWDPASVCNIDNNGTVAGLGGRARQGGTAAYLAGAWYFQDGSDADDGGDAIDIQMDTTIDNGSGYIFGGGGGGGSGAAASDENPGDSGSFAAGGGGGGGGQGYNNAVGGSAGDGNVDNATAGTAGSSAGNGSGGDGGVAGFTYGGAGGNGGTWGLPGSFGGTGTGTYKTTRGARGAAGYAIRKNGFTVTITAGNNSSQIKGSVA